MRGETSAQGWTHVHDLQIAHLGIGRDSLLDDRSKRTTDQSAKQSKDNRKWNADDPPEGGFRSSHREPGKSPGEKRSGSDIGSASGMDGKIAFARAQTRQRLSRGRLNIVGWKIAEDEEAGWVGMSSHGAGWMLFGQHMKRGMFEGMVASRFENEGKIQNGIRHAVIILFDAMSHLHLRAPYAVRGAGVQVLRELRSSSPALCSFSVAISVHMQSTP